MTKFIMDEINVHPDRLAEFLSELLQKLAGQNIRAAFWFYHPVSLPVPAQVVTGTSPFPNSGSSLAGDGYLVQLTSTNAGKLMAFFAEDLDALSALIHLEIESAGQLQFRAYDSFEINLPAPALDDEWLNELANRGIITVE